MGREAGVGLYSEDGGEAGETGGDTDLCLMGERDLSLPGGLRPGDQECFTDTGDIGLGDTGGLDLASGLPTMESMEKPSLFLISLLKIFGWTRLG